MSTPHPRPTPRLESMLTGHCIVNTMTKATMNGAMAADMRPSTEPAA